MPREPAETGPHSRFLQPRAGSWPAIAEVARSQHGVISLSQLIDCGFTAAGVTTLAQAKKLHRVHRGVYALGPAPLSPLGNRMAAVLACGPGSLLAGRSAGTHLGLIANSSSLIDVMTPRQVRRRGIRAHALPTLAAADRVTRLAVPCTSVARTLLDLAAVRSSDVRDALEQAETLGEFDLNAIDDVLERNAGHRGVRRLRNAVRAMGAGGPRFRSEFERRLMPIFREARLPVPLVNHTIELPDGPIEVDFWWPSLRLVAEVDGYRFHGNRRGFRNDRRRDRGLAAVGILSVRFVWEDLDDRRRLVAELSSVLASRLALSG